MGSSSPWQEQLNPASCTTADTTNQPRPLSSEPPHSLRILLNTALGSPSGLEEEMKTTCTLNPA